MSTEYTPKTDEELKALALGIREGRIFSSLSIKRIEDLSMVFMVLAFLEPKDMEELKAQEMCFFYEELSKALPRSINGMPIFMSVQMLNRADKDRLHEIWGKIEEALGKI